MIDACAGDVKGTIYRGGARADVVAAKKKAAGLRGPAMRYRALVPTQMRGYYSEGIIMRRLDGAYLQDKTGSKLDRQAGG
jgi:hypothetical protein